MGGPKRLEGFGIQLRPETNDRHRVGPVGQVPREEIHQGLSVGFLPVILEPFHDVPVVELDIDGPGWITLVLIDDVNLRCGGSMRGHFLKTRIPRLPLGK